MGKQYRCSRPQPQTLPLMTSLPIQSLGLFCVLGVLRGGLFLLAAGLRQSYDAQEELRSLGGAV